ncbi:uncharacterized protein LOC113648047 [Tachysurus fulvidraco]|uniref:uncharacterized protein LOC113648047 n=1 Tax=Tachysurus fulvidraco TaxID=1234273 RepID=UPI001FED9ECC|nr:uncharacterized protein LOC113648047 [Tachysurus fulvidraco]
MNCLSRFREGAIMMRKVVTTDASLTGWGATQEGRSVNGVWPISLRSAHINYLELLTVLKALKYFLPRDHVLVRCDNRTAVAYINRQGGLHSSKLHALAHKLLVWSTQHFLSLWMTRIPGLLNRGADLQSGECRVEAPPPDSGAALGEVRPGCLRSLRLAQKRPLSYVLLASGRGLPPRHGHSGTSMAQHAALRFPSALPDIPDPGKARGAEFISDPHSSQVAQDTLASGDNSSSVCRVVAPPVAYGPPGPGEWGDFCLTRAGWLSGPGP